MNYNHHATRVAIAAEDPIVRYGVLRLFEAEADLIVVGEAASVTATIKLVTGRKPDVLLLDLTLPSSGLEVLNHLATVRSCARTLLLASSNDHGQISEAFNLGARGVIFKGSATRLLLNGIRAVVAGRYWVGEKTVAGVASALRNFEPNNNGRKPARIHRLTPRELEIIATILTGCSNKDVGRRFSITERTVKHHLTNIYEKLGLSNRLELALFAVNHHLEVHSAPTALSREDIEAKYAEAI